MKSTDEEDRPVGVAGASHTPKAQPAMVPRSMANALSDIATLLERGALTPTDAAQWLRHLVELIRNQPQERT
ncbi:MAG TPA: hypothetical protein VL614_00585 [Acetobacteraceae bacterium]|jgi:hypothetical protein|nr:hypothetical protein [Acetobacteraceae bacterium]